MERPIFVVGCPRSGTTLLQLMLHAHPRIAIPPETRFLLPAYYRRAEFGDLRVRANRRALGEWITGTRGHKFPDLGLDPAETVRRIEAAPPTLGSALGTVLQEYARRHGKARWGDKRPAYIQYLPEIFRLFPDAQVVHLIRDGRDCVGSLKGMKWWEHDSLHSVATWAGAIDAGHEAARHCPDGSYYALQYEHLVADPAPQLSALCEFLGERYDPAMLHPETVASVNPRRKKHHARTHKNVDMAVVRAWEERLEPWEVQLCEYVLGERLRAYGYQLSGLGRPPAAVLGRYARTLARYRQAALRRGFKDGWHRLVSDDDLACRPGGSDHGLLTAN